MQAAPVVSPVATSVAPSAETPVDVSAGDKQRALIDSLPAHLKQFVAVQDYDQYTPRDHAVWRFLLGRLQAQLADSAHPVYLDGLRRTGISVEQIPRLEEMNACLEKIGWGVLGVDGFIPPAIFMEFQARRILVIATTMRTLDQLLYTPAPDIVHESAGHAPFLIDVDYAEFLQRFGEIGTRVLTRREDQEIYEAIRHLSILKEDPGVDAGQIDAAEQRLERAVAANQIPSEATLLARLHWWTVEYGLVGTLDDYRLYGAGLLSSLGESSHCVNDELVAKRLLTLDAIHQSYDITREQPCLYVTHSCRHLCQVLEDMARGLAQTTGGLRAVQAAIDCGTVVTLAYDSGLQVSGQASGVVADAMGNVSYINTTGPTQLAFNDTQLPGQGISEHAQGFGSPVGYVNGFKRCLSEYSIDELRFVGIEIGQPVSLEYVSGITVQGLLTGIERRKQKNLLFSFDDCRVTTASGECLFDPAWGRYDMAIGTAIASVYGGVADPVAFPQYAADAALAAEPSRVRVASARDRQRFAVYQQLRDCRAALAAGDAVALASIAALCQALLDAGEEEWLLLYEAVELLLRAQDPAQDTQLLDALRRQLLASVPDEPQLQQVVSGALAQLEQQYQAAQAAVEPPCA